MMDFNSEVCLLIFGLDNLSIDESGALKSSSVYLMKLGTQTFGT
jgi:hypothetical protein